MPNSKCSWCGLEIPATARADSKFCGRKCRQAAWRIRGYSAIVEKGSGETRLPLRFAFADPPYPGTGKKYYGKQPNFDGEVDHRKLIAGLVEDYDGWALSTNARSLRELLPLCPPETRVCAWVKPGGAPPATFGLHNVWEPLLVLQGRRVRPGRRDAIYIHPARFGGDLPGRKPLKFCAWMFNAMGMQAGDSFQDLFPGTGIVSRAWAEISGRQILKDFAAVRQSIQGKLFGADK